MIKESLDGSRLPFGVEEIEKDHPFQIALKRHQEAGLILHKLVQIESFRVDALRRMKETEGEEKNDAASALAILMNKRAEAKKQYQKYYSAAIQELKKQ